MEPPQQSFSDIINRSLKKGPVMGRLRVSKAQMAQIFE